MALYDYYFMNRKTTAQILIPLIAILCFLPFLGSASALLLGVAIAVFLGNPYSSQKYIHTLLAFAVAGLGAGMNLETVTKVGLQGIEATFISISSIFLLGFILLKLLRVDKDTGLLITAGTAICGGSAIAALSPILGSKHHSTSVALGTVFVLNAIALIVFPPIGHILGIPEKAFGLWSALAIHDTSSVVGATLTYGPTAAVIGTTVKLARALWIVPITILVSFISNRSNIEKNTPVKKPWFIAWFIFVAALVTWVPSLRPAGYIIELISKKMMVLTLFLIGLSLSRETIKSVGIRPFILGITLWLITGAVSLLSILYGLIKI